MKKSAMYLNLACFRKAKEGDLLCEGEVVLDEGTVILVTTTGSRFIEVQRIRQPLVGAQVKVWLRQGEVAVERADVTAEEKKKKINFGAWEFKKPEGYGELFTADWVVLEIIDYDMAGLMGLNGFRDGAGKGLRVVWAGVKPGGFAMVISGNFPAQKPALRYATLFYEFELGREIMQSMIGSLIRFRVLKYETQEKQTIAADVWKKMVSKPSKN
ncbi:MAG: hypothetical protein A3F54_05510 [Candidatus Kerfeldbacteria bacterium RIFCSPHIGHO2_12_FULL_48_17]|uniref:Uncharacterized protein n=1 Tax=Candidatus Kerfeldbacteria bacterium RIFCSPHIGHO2_12_FULL_48_17 TaxID=1798542 RepID=A0A1G2B5Q3_9BACT|nr:MAG: hypothetical protein A3F54_05510 [Candidatus Kerfeldbacteria bacterium RIFCSPHIGHO2_12_FULL_48_17]